MIARGLGPRRRLVALSAAAALLGGCALTNLKAPDVTPTAVEPIDVQLDQQRIKVSLHVQNPNDRALPIKSVHCKLEIQGVEVGQGESSAPFNVPAHGESDVDMIVTTNLATSMPNLILRLARDGEMPSYRISGSVNPDITLLPPIPFWKSGKLTLPSY